MGRAPPRRFTKALRRVPQPAFRIVRQEHQHLSNDRRPADARPHSVVLKWVEQAFQAALKAMSLDRALTPEVRSLVKWNAAASPTSAPPASASRSAPRPHRD